MPEMKKVIKIKKQSYRFELRKKYFNKKKFHIPEKLPIDLVKEALQKNFFPKRAPGEVPNRKPMIIIGFVVLAAVLFMLFAFSQKPAAPVTDGKTFAAAPTLDTVIRDFGIASMGGRVADKRVAYYALEYTATNADSINVSSATYPNHAPNTVFLLVSKMDQASIYPEFKYDLRKRLEAKGLSLNEISLEQLETLPEGALVLIPSGLIPDKLVQPGGANIVNLLQRGVDIMYIGDQFDFSITEAGNRKKIAYDLRSKLPFYFDAADLKSGGRLQLASSLYRVRVYMETDAILLYGMLSTGRLGKGTIVFIPQTLDSGWEKDANKAAEDVDKIITEFKWLYPQDSRSESAQVAENKTFYSLFYSPRFSEREKSVIVRVVASNPGNSTEKISVLYPRSDVNGDLYFVKDITRIVSGKITEESAQMIAEINENSSDKRNLFLSVLDVYGSEVQPRRAISSGAGGKVDLQGSTQFSEQLNLDSGVYIAAIVDDSRNQYARGIMDVMGVDFNIVSSDMSRGVFNFSSTANGQPVAIKKLDIVLDNQYKYTFEEQSSFMIDLRTQLGGGSLSPGNHTFSFQFGDARRDIVLEKSGSTNLMDNPIVWIIAAIIIVPLFLGAPHIASLMQKVEYALDIPDFPPLASMKIPMKPETVLGIFEKVNEDYRWKSTPLKLEEMKKGFRKIIYQNKPIFISDYNLEYLLEQLKNKGHIKEALDYYGLARWEKDTGKTIAQLAIQRKIRDICINEAIPFSKLGESPDYDINLKVLGQDVYVYIMDDPERKEEKLTLALKMMQKGLAVLLFQSAGEKKDFEDTVSSASETSGMIKMEMMAGSLTPLTINELEKMLKEMKNI